MKKFEIELQNSTIGFQTHVNLNPLSQITEQLKRHKISLNDTIGSMAPELYFLRTIIEKNASLRIGFGWSFESTHLFKTAVNECFEKVTTKIPVNSLVSDTRCDWLGFVPYNTFEKIAYEDLSRYGLIAFNNDLINFQIDFVTELCNNVIFKQHAILRDRRYRYDYFKSVRKDTDALRDAFFFYMSSIHEICVVSGLPRDLLEEDIGCHFLHHPDLFFELVNFSILKGDIHE